MERNRQRNIGDYDNQYTRDPSVQCYTTVVQFREQLEFLPYLPTVRLFCTRDPSVHSGRDRTARGHDSRWSTRDHQHQSNVPG